MTNTKGVEDGIEAKPCEHEYEAIDAGPYSDDICYEVCKKCHREKELAPKLELKGEGGEAPKVESPEELPPPDAWTIETMMLINKLTPEIKEKAFDPDWFLLRQRFELMEHKHRELLAENKRLLSPSAAVPVEEEK